MATTTVMGMLLFVFLPGQGTATVRTALALYPFLLVCAAVSCLQKLVWLPMPGIFNASTDLDYTRVLFIVNPFIAMILFENDP